MNCKKSTAPFLLLTVFALTVVSTAVVQSTSEEQTRNVYSMDLYGLVIKIGAPYHVYPGENINLTVSAEAPDVDVYVEYIHLKIYGLVNETDRIVLGSFTHLENFNLSHAFPHTDIYQITIGNETSPGLTYGEILCKWTFLGMTVETPDVGFIVTYIKNKEAEELYNNYQELNSTYWSLQDNYTKLESQYSGELGSTRNMMYVLIVTTVVSVASVFFLMRRPKKWW